MGGQRRVLIVEIVRARLLDGLRHRPMQATLLRSEKGRERRLADAVVREVERLTDLTEDAPPH